MAGKNISGLLNTTIELAKNGKYKEALSKGEEAINTNFSGFMDFLYDELRKNHNTVSENDRNSVIEELGDETIYADDVDAEYWEVPDFCLDIIEKQWDGVENISAELWNDKEFCIAAWATANANDDATPIDYVPDELLLNDKDFLQFFFNASLGNPDSFSNAIQQKIKSLGITYGGEDSVKSRQVANIWLRCLVQRYAGGNFQNESGDDIDDSGRDSVHIIHSNMSKPAGLDDDLNNGSGSDQIYNDYTAKGLDLQDMLTDADSYCEQGQYAKAMKLFDCIAENEIEWPDDDDFENTYHQFISTAYKGLGQLDKAIAAISKSIKGADDSDDTAAVRYLTRADIYEAAGEYKKAIADCKKSLALDPDMGTYGGNREDADSPYSIMARCEKALKPTDTAKAAAPKPSAVPAVTEGQTCAKCGKPLKGGAKFCPECGAKVEPPKPKQKFCSECGAKLEAGVKFCPECGAKV